jgi:nucleotide-binding universal stress UspA family protein
MRALIWIVEGTWQATVEDAARLLPDDTEITLLHVTNAESEAVARGARHGLLGRHPPTQAAAARLRVVSEEEAEALLAEAQTRLGRQATLEARRGQVEREVVTAAKDMDMLLLARDADHERLGPRSIGPATRFVIDHAPCRVLLIWPDATPELTTLPRPPSPGDSPSPIPGANL